MASADPSRANRAALDLLQADAPHETHELRVRVSEDLHRQLLSLKILRGRSLADTVCRALDAYFARDEAQTAGEPIAA